MSCFHIILIILIILIIHTYQTQQTYHYTHHIHVICVMHIIHVISYMRSAYAVHDCLIDFSWLLYSTSNIIIIIIIITIIIIIIIIADPLRQFSVWFTHPFKRGSTFLKAKAATEASTTAMDMALLLVRPTFLKPENYHSSHTPDGPFLFFLMIQFDDSNPYLKRIWKNNMLIPKNGTW